MGRELEAYQLIERSIIKKYRKDIWNPFVTAIKRYQLIEENDNIAVCISGGKDSMLLAKLMQQMHRHSDVPFKLTFLVMDPGYNPFNRQKIENNAKLLHIPIEVFETDIFDAVEEIEQSPCYLCARMRRGHLYSKAKELGCNKIALGHHFSDVIETTVMGMFYGAQIQAMLPKLHSNNFEGMALIRPMYCIHEDSIISWKNYNKLTFIQCACRFTENCSIVDNAGGGSKRQVVKGIIKKLKQENPLIEKNIFNSIHEVNVDTLIGFKHRGQLHDFLDLYNSKN
jgi:Predicted ATPase of the PP-loop superfamily implicated in cell cycle control